MYIIDGLSHIFPLLFFTKPICTERREEVHRKGHQEAMPEPGMASSAKI